jgi:AAA ATPase domain
VTCGSFRMCPPTATLGRRLVDRDRARFVGRQRELDFFEQLFGDDPPANVVLVHGPAGIGKSTLLRHVVRRGERCGWRPHWIEGRDLPPLPDAVEDALAGAREEERPLIVFDSYERMTALGGYLRRSVLRSLPERTIVVVAGRGLPEASWSAGGWETVVRELELGGLSRQESRELLRLAGVEDEGLMREAVLWSGGSPLALALTAERGVRWRPASEGGGPADPGVVRALVRRLAGSELEGAQFAVLGVAAIARLTTVDLLRHVLPETNAQHAYEWLASRTFTEPLGDGVTLHDLVGKALRADLRRRDPSRQQELRRRIADYLHARAVAGNLLLSVDLAHLIENPAIRWGYSWEGSARYRIDSVRPGDAEAVRAVLAERGHGGWWPLLERFFDEAPARIGIARDQEDRLAGYLVSITPRNAPSFAADDPLLGPWLAHARSRSPSGNAVLWHDAVDLAGRDSGVQAMLGVAGILQSGLTNPRLAYLPIRPRLPEALEFARVLGARHVPELDLQLAGVRVECHLLDYGPGGLLGGQRDVVYAEAGLRPPHARSIDVEVVRQALRDLGVPSRLAASELATGDALDERAESVRALLSDAAEHAFGETADELLLRRVLVRGYLDPAASHELAAEELNLSRATYFRRLKQAVARIAAHLGEAGWP